MSEHTAENDVPVYRSRWATCDDCECSTVIERNDKRGVPDEADWDSFPTCLVCGGTLHWNADQDTVADRYWRMGKAAATRPIPPGISEPRPLPLHRTEAGYPNCSTCDGGGCLDCTDPA